jgi:hypothetical protein
MNGLLKGHLVDGDGYNSVLGVAHTSQRTGFVDEFHDPAAVNIAVMVGVFGLHQL